MHCPKVSLDHECQGQRSKVKVTEYKREKCGIFGRRVAVLRCPVLRQFYAGGIII